ncbi:MAG: isochorismatase family protein [Cellvibrionaceae bacterium]|nr:isochorismatase family protein [Cellvibrionaceae bacterium]
MVCFDTDKPVLMLIDWQQAIDHFGGARRSHPGAEQAAAQLLKAWRQRAWPICFIRHSSKFTDSPYHCDSPHFKFKPELAPLEGEWVLSKRENCAFIGTGLEDSLRQRGLSELVVSGVLLNHSVDATVRVAAGLGFKVLLAADATPAMAVQARRQQYTAEQVHELYLANLAGEYAEPVDVSELI